ncbi:hypothetical protein OROGR_006857 [Orobanche gracilis]
MQRIRGSAGTPNLFCNCGISKPQQHEDTLPGLRIFPGSKRRLDDNMQVDEESRPNTRITNNTKRRHLYLIEKSVNRGCNQIREGDFVEIIRRNSSLSFGSAKSHCAVEGCLSKGFAQLLSDHSCLQFDQDTKVSYA